MTTTTRARAACAAVLALIAVLTLTVAHRPAARTAPSHPAIRPPSLAVGAELLRAFPYRHVSVLSAGQAPGTPAPAGTLWVTVDDGAAAPRSAVSRAVPADGRPLPDAAYTNPTACEQVNAQPGVCWRLWQRIGTQVRIWTSYHGASCVLLADLTGQPSRLNCAGRSTNL